MLITPQTTFRGLLVDAVNNVTKPVAAQNHQQRTNELITELRKFEALTEDQIQEAYEDHIKKVREAYDADIAAYKLRLLVEEWSPPTSNHDALKELMRKQITLNEGRNVKRAPLCAPDAMEFWYNRRLNTLRADLLYHMRAHNEALDALRNHASWLAQVILPTKPNTKRR